MGERTNDQDKTAFTALRRVASNNLQLYTQADKKAQILIQVNALMISVLLGGVMEASLRHRLVLIPVTNQLFFSFVVVLLSLRSTRPSVTPTHISGDQTQDLLQFSEYDQLEKEEYMDDIKDMVDDPELTCAGLLRNIYYQAQVLISKYRYLRWAYGIFVVGLGITVLLAIGAAIL